MHKVSVLLLVVLSLIFPSVQGAGVIQQFRRLRRFFHFVRAAQQLRPAESFEEA